MQRLAIAIAALALASFATGYASATPSDPVEHSGCCSSHGGVCGCSGDRALCCDGTPSKSCGCD